LRTRAIDSPKRSATCFRLTEIHQSLLGMSQAVGNLSTRFRAMEEARSAVHNLRFGGSRRASFLVV
jgi:hypothetical protein